MATTTVESNKETVRKQFKFFCEGDNDNFGKYRTNEGITHEPGPEPNGLEACKDDIHDARAMFPDFHLEIDDMVTEGDTVVVDWMLTNTHEEEVARCSVNTKRPILGNWDSGVSFESTLQADSDAILEEYASESNVADVDEHARQVDSLGESEVIT